MLGYTPHKGEIYMESTGYLKQIKKDLDLLDILKDDPSLPQEERDKILSSYYTWIEFIEEYIKPSPELTLESCSRREMLCEEKAFFENNDSIFDLLISFGDQEQVSYTDVKSTKLTVDDMEKTLVEIMNFICDEELFAKFIRLYNFKKTHINLLGGKNKNANKNVSFYITAFNDPYSFANKNLTPKGLTLLIHELGHALKMLTNYSSVSYDTEIYSEIISNVFELLSTYYLAKNPRFHEFAKNRQAFYWNDYLSLTKKCLLQAKFLGTLAYEDIIYATLREFRLTASTTIRESPYKCNYQELLKPVITSNIKYILGYIIAIEVVMLYDQNRNMGIEKLKALISIKDNISAEEYLNHLLNIITPGKSLTTYKNLILNPQK